MKNDGLVLVEPGVQWTRFVPETPAICGGDRGLKVESRRQAVVIGPAGDHGEHHFLTPAQARRVGWALLEAADLAEKEGRDA